jgi:DNA-directed RNA polymerase specialized sigma24 family protein
VPSKAVRTSASRFPATRLSIIDRLGSGEPEVRRHAFGVLVEGYWKPIYTYARLKWRLAEADAQDATQGFLATAFEKGYFERFDPAKARFRTFLRTCLDRYIQNERKAAHTLKRGGDLRIVSLDFVTAEGEVGSTDPPDPMDPDRFFRAEWVRALFARSVDEVRAACAAQGKDLHYRLFEHYDLGPAERPSYAELGAQVELPVTQVTNYLAAVRRMFRIRVLENLREICGTEDEFRAEARELLGVELP